MPQAATTASSKEFEAQEALLPIQKQRHKL
jgi:hypothetical protein